jgi:uncharacterized protein with PQ loop repeat
MEQLDKYSLWWNKQQIQINIDQYANNPDLITQYNAEYIKNVNAINSKYSVSTSTVVLSSLGLAVGIAMMVFGIYTIIQIANKYNVKYTEIPTIMVDSVETLNGKRYIKYNVVKEMYQDGDKISERQGDTNGYNGEQWNAIYYTKSYEAGKCMTANAYIIDSESNFGKYTPVAKFGAKTCFDLNSFNGNKNGDKLFIAFGNSNNKKSAETSVPTIVGSVISYGALAVTGVAGLAVGMGAMALIKRKKEKNVTV